MEIDQDIDRTLLRWPPDEQGFDGEDDSEVWESASGNRRFTDLRGFDAADVNEAVEIEGAWLVGHPQDWADDLDDELFNQLTEVFGGDLASLDVGTASPAIALSAAGCVSVASCNGGAGHQYDCPTIEFFAPALVIDLLRDAAKAANCGLGNASTGALVLYAQDIRCFIRFARALQSRLPPDASWDAP